MSPISPVPPVQPVPNPGPRPPRKPIPKPKEKAVCNNCGDGYGKVTVEINCPVCSGHGLNEISELRMLAAWLYKNFKKRTRIPSDGLTQLNRVRRSQGKSEL